MAVQFVKPDTGTMALRAQALFAWMQLEYRDKNTAIADSLLDDLLTHYGQTIYAQQARILFASKRKHTPGESAYESAYAILRNGGLTSAKASLLTVASSYPEEDAAPRSLYAIGLSYEEAKQYDSAVVYYKQVMKDYPYSVYAIALKPRLADATAGLPHAPPPVLDPMLTPSDSIRAKPQTPAKNMPAPRPTPPQTPRPVQQNPMKRPPMNPRGRPGIPRDTSKSPIH